MSVDDSRSPPQLTDYEKELIKSLRAERRRKPGGGAQADIVVPPVPAVAAPAPSAPSAAQVHTGRSRSPAPPASRDPVEAPRSRSLGNQLEESASRPRAPSLAERVRDAQPQSPVATSGAAVADAQRASRAAPQRTIAEDRQQPPGPSPVQGATSRPMPASPGHQASVPTPLPAADAPAPRSNRRSALRAGLFLGALLVAAVAAVIAVPAFERAANVKPPASIARDESAKARLPPAQDSGNTALVESPKAPVEDDFAQTLEAMFAGFPSDRRKGRAEFRKALLSTAPDSEVRRRYLEVSVSGLRLRGAPSETGPVLAVVRRGAYVRLKERSAADDWCEVRLPQSREGWTKCSFLKPIAELAAVPGVHGGGKEAARR